MLTIHNFCCMVVLSLLLLAFVKQLAIGEVPFSWVHRNHSGAQKILASSFKF